MFIVYSYFDDNDDNNLEYQPAPGSPGQEDGKQEESEGEDPLDAFMAEIEVLCQILRKTAWLFSSHTLNQNTIYM